MTPKHTTLRLNEALMRRAKAYAQRHHTTLTAVMEQALLEYISERPSKRTYPGVFDLPVFGGGGLRPGVDLDNNAALLDLMDGIE